ITASRSSTVGSSNGSDPTRCAASSSFSETPTKPDRSGVTPSRSARRTVVCLARSRGMSVGTPEMDAAAGEQPSRSGRAKECHHRPAAGNAGGPVGRNVDEGFEIGFQDLVEGRLTKINVDYFQYFDKIIDTLINHGITPVLQPVFHGFGWKGLGVAGPVVPPADYARYCRYLVARYGARPAIYLPWGDGSGTA